MTTDEIEYILQIKDKWEAFLQMEKKKLDLETTGSILHTVYQQNIFIFTNFINDLNRLLGK